MTLLRSLGIAGSIIAGVIALAVVYLIVDVVSLGNVGASPFVWVFLLYCAMVGGPAAFLAIVFASLSD